MVKNVAAVEHNGNTTLLNKPTTNHQSRSSVQEVQENRRTLNKVQDYILRHTDYSLRHLLRDTIEERMSNKETRTKTVKKNHEQGLWEYEVRSS